MRKLLFAAVVILASAGMAMAQAVTETTVPVAVPVTVSAGTWAGDVLTWLAAAFAVPVGAVLTAALWKLFQLLGVQVTDQMKSQLQSVIVNGLNQGAANISGKLRGAGQVEIKNAIVADAVQYTQEYAAETIKALGLDPQSGAAVDAIKARIETALNDPATPTPAVITPDQGVPQVSVVTKPSAVGG